MNIAPSTSLLGNIRKYVHVLFGVCVFSAGAAHSQPLQLNELPTGSLGTWAEIYVEDGRALSLDEAQILLREGKFHQYSQSILSQGIGAKPQWLHLELVNPSEVSLPLKLVVGTTWIDSISVYLVHGNLRPVRWQTGDEFPNAPGLTQGIGYILPPNFPPGRSDLFLRVESIDSLIFPIELLTEKQAVSQQQLVHYSYGFIIGFLISLTIYNSVLFVGLRRRSHLYYAIYLTSLIVLIICFTGHGSAWLWPGQPLMQRYVILVMMVIYGCCGLLFASRYLDLKQHSPRTLQWVQSFVSLGLLAILISILLESHLAAARVAFVFMMFFTVWMAYLGLLTIRANHVSGQFFFTAALFGMLGSAITTLAVWGVIPFTTVTYHALEYGMVIEATLFALALSHHFNELNENLAKINVLNHVLSKEVAERKLIEKSLHESEGRYHTLVEWSPNPIAVHRSGKLIYVNPATIKLFGASSAQDLVGKPILDLIHPDFHQVVLARIKENIKDGLSVPQIDEKFLKLDGTVIDVEVQGTSIIYDGEPAIHAALRDITEQKLKEEKLMVTQFVSDHSPESIIWIDEQARLVYVNEEACREHGYTKEEMLAMSTSDFAPDFPVDAWSSHWQALKQAGALTFESRHSRKDGSIFPIEVSANFIKFGGIEFNVVYAKNITQRKTAEEEIQNLAFYDPLTQLPNRRLLMDRLNQALSSSARDGHKGSLLFIDLDNFKALNDTLGHEVGDLLLQQVAKRLESCVREGDTVSRLGGDEYVVIVGNLNGNALESATQVEMIGEKILSVLNQPYQLDAHKHHSTPSIGITIFSGHEQTQDELLKQADIAMYQAKKAGRNTLRFFDPQMQDAITASASLESDLRRAIAEQKEFQLYYQLQVDSSGRSVGAEALLRWKHPEHGIVSPVEFIPLAEETGLILPLGHWVLKTACMQLVAWATQPKTAHLTIAVNISAKQFNQPNFVDSVLALVEHFGVAPEKLKLEITESLLLDNVNDIVVKMDLLNARGISFSMDDFGTGYSSLSVLKHLPLQQLKIDKSFVHDVLTDANDVAISKMIITLAHSMNLEVIAEGVETEAQRELLELNGCHNYQGYLFSKPIPIEEFDSLLKQG
ncbi:MAG: EAL domain-containing protein [Gallionellaceae bacterium]